MAKTLASLGKLSGKTVLLRADFNVPLKNGVITDDGRIRAALPTVSALTTQGARVLIISHLGRPEGKPDPAFSLAPVAHRLGELLDSPVAFAGDTVGPEAQKITAELRPGEVAVLENLRFNPEETSKDSQVRQAFAAQLAKLADVFVSDGFGVVHRKQASVYEIAQLLESASGQLIETEVGVLKRLTESVEKPFTVILGGSKVSDKLAVLDHLLPKVDNLLIGGGQVFTFLAAQGYPIGKSLVEPDQLEAVKGYLAKAVELGVNLVLPSDITVAAAFAPDAEHWVVSSENIESTPAGAAGTGLDIGPEASAAFAKIIERSRTVFWNGPMGVFEFPAFAAGTEAVARALTKVEGLSVVGGGDSAAAVRSLGFDETAFSHISTGGGASLEYLEGKKLPGLEVLGWQ